MQLSAQREDSERPTASLLATALLWLHGTSVRAQKLQDLLTAGRIWYDGSADRQFFFCPTLLASPPRSCLGNWTYGELSRARAIRGHAHHPITLRAGSDGTLFAAHRSSRKLGDAGTVQAGKRIDAAARVGPAVIGRTSTKTCRGQREGTVCLHEARVQGRAGSLWKARPSSGRRACFQGRSAVSKGLKLRCPFCPMRHVLQPSGTRAGDKRWILLGTPMCIAQDSHELLPRRWDRSWPRGSTWSRRQVTRTPTAAAPRTADCISLHVNLCSAPRDHPANAGCTSLEAHGCMLGDRAPPQQAMGHQFACV